MSKSEGLSYDDTITTLDELYPQPDNEMTEDMPCSAIPEAILSVIENRTAIESLGSMIWYI